MRLMVLIFALTFAVALAGTVTYVAPAPEVDPGHDESAIKPSWQDEAAFAEGIDSEGGMEADLDGNASALGASAWQ